MKREREHAPSSAGGQRSELEEMRKLMEIEGPCPALPPEGSPVRDLQRVLPTPTAASQLSEYLLY